LVRVRTCARAGIWRDEGVWGWGASTRIYGVATSGPENDGNMSRFHQLPSGKETYYPWKYGPKSTQLLQKGVVKKSAGTAAMGFHMEKKKGIQQSERRELVKKDIRQPKWERGGREQRDGTTRGTLHTFAKTGRNTVRASQPMSCSEQLRHKARSAWSNRENRPTRPLKAGAADSMAVPKYPGNRRLHRNWPSRGTGPTL